MTKPIPPMMPGLPLVGNVLAFRKDRAAFGPARRRQTDRFRFRLQARAPADRAALIGPELHQVFFTETDKKLAMDKPYRSLAAALGKVAFLASPETYQEQRPILYAPFTHQKMVQYIRIMQDVVQAWLDGLGEAGVIDISAEISRLVQNVAGYALMGEDFQQRAGRGILGAVRRARQEHRSDDASRSASAQEYPPRSCQGQDASHPGADHCGAAPEPRPVR